MWHNPLIIIHYFSGIATVMSVFHVLFSVPNHIYFSKYAFRLLPIIITQDSERLFKHFAHIHSYYTIFLILFAYIFPFFICKLAKRHKPKWICAFLVSLSLILFLFFFLLQLLPRRLPITLQLLSFPMLSYLQLSHCHFHHYFLLR